MTPKIKFKKVHLNAKLPTQGKPGDAAFDLSCVNAFSLSPGETIPVPTGLFLADMPSQMEGSDVYLQIEGRSKLAKLGVQPLGGVIDSTYRGEIIVLLTYNETSYNPLTNKGLTLFFKPGDRIAQFVIRKIVTNVSFEETDEVTETVRGDAGFGSTGA
jgi:dUTP pyrophosphatase